VPRRVVAPLPVRPQRLRFHPVTACDAADQRRGGLPLQGSGPQEAGTLGHSTTVSCSPIRAGVFAVTVRFSARRLPASLGRGSLFPGACRRCVAGIGPFERIVMIRSH
jgi:hypothetical protein